MTKVMVKKHVRNGVEVEAHEREVSEGESMDLGKKLKLASSTKKKKQKLQKLFFGGKKWGDST